MKNYLDDLEIAKKYDSLEVLGEGGFGKVFWARQKDLSFVAPEPSTVPKLKELFAKEMLELERKQLTASSIDR